MPNFGAHFLAIEFSSHFRNQTLKFQKTDMYKEDDTSLCTGEKVIAGVSLEAFDVDKGIRIQHVSCSAAAADSSCWDGMIVTHSSFSTHAYTIHIEV